MPIVFSKIAADWDAAVVAGATLPTSSTYQAADDNHTTRIYLNFTYYGEDFHLTVTLGSGGVARAFHVTAENPKTTQLEPNGKQAGTTYTIKRLPSAYYNFVIARHSSNGLNVDFSSTKKVEIVGERTLTVESASFKKPFIDEVHNIMKTFVLHMLSLGTEHATLG